MMRESHHQYPHHHDDNPVPESFDQEGSHQRGGRRRHHRHGGGRGGYGPGGPGGPAAFGPPGRRRRPKGAIREAILSLLAEGPANGYSLMKQISERAEGSWSPSPGSVYPTLAQLVDEGLIAPSSTDKGTDYALTDAGRENVERNSEALSAIWADSAQGSASRLALRDSVTALMGVLQQYRLASTDEQRERAVEVLDQTRKALYAVLAE